MKLQENIQRIREVMGVLNEETAGIEQFLQKVVSVYPETIHYIEHIKKFIESSNCKKIDVASFKYPALGLALHNGVIFNEKIFSNSIFNFLFIIFHEIAHQYQYKKYGDDKMYEFYLGDIGVKEAAIAMKEIEIVADEFAKRKLREFVKLGFIKKDDKVIYNDFYKKVPLSHFEMLIKQTKDKIKSMNVTDFDGVANIFYNMLQINI